MGEIDKAPSRTNALVVEYGKSSGNTRARIFSKLLKEMRGVINYHSYIYTKQRPRTVKEDVEQDAKIVMLECLKNWKGSLNSRFATYYATSLKYIRYTKDKQRVLISYESELPATENGDIDFDIIDTTNYQTEYQIKLDGRKVLRLIDPILNKREKKILYQLYSLDLLHSEISKRHNISEPRVCQIKNIILGKIRQYPAIERMANDYK